MSIHQNRHATAMGLLKHETQVVASVGCLHKLTFAEAAIVATSPMQRLRRLRQTGFGYFDNPCSEHTRLSHSIGTVYWANALYEGLTSPQNSEASQNAEHLLSLTDRLAQENVSFDLLMRVFALVHDIALLPFGHTLRFQLGHFFDRRTFFDAMRNQLSGVIRELEHGPLRTDPAALQELKRHIALAECVAHAPRIIRGVAVPALPDTDGSALTPALSQAILEVITLTYDIVHGVYSADLIDICDRDLASAGVRWTMPDSLLNSGVLIHVSKGEPVFPGPDSAPTDRVLRYGVGRGGQAISLQPLRELAGVHRERLEIAARCFYGENKCNADAMLDKAIRCLQADLPGLMDDPAFALSERLAIGDDDFLDLLIDTAETAASGTALALLTALKGGRLLATALSVDVMKEDALVRRLGQFLATPAMRTAFEAELAAALPAVRSDQIVALALPEDMQAKSAETPALGADGVWRAFSDLCAQEPLDAGIPDLPQAYRTLRCANVYVTPELADRAEEVAAAVRRKLTEKPVERIDEGFVA
ncbi:hypothetical protein K4K94_18260 (plasmid) [Phaeobacter inhibens]|uniref:hypothetical protein n=1 Tax=Phaeobacter inhibens TaxID=221822 RepID=UPI0021A73497|nr:hypothetical protein [Phaeobacter inhibens]UWS06048.1 hypothetical protein K4K94_18260 [Phaeobacter inhibens]